jgi:hypothetical protein
MQPSVIAIAATDTNTLLRATALIKVVIPTITLSPI